MAFAEASFWWGACSSFSSKHWLRMEVKVHGDLRRGRRRCYVLSRVACKRTSRLEVVAMAKPGLEDLPLEDRERGPFGAVSGGFPSVFDDFS